MKAKIEDFIYSVYLWVSKNGRKYHLVHFFMAVANFFRTVIFKAVDFYPITKKAVYAEMEKYNLPAYTEKEKRRLYRDYKRTYITDFITLDDYLTLGFFGKTRAERNTYYTESFYQHHYYCIVLNGKESTEILSNKSIFAEKLGKNFGRHFLNFTPETTRDEFDEFVSHCSTIFVKPNFSYAGYGIQKEVLNTPEDIDDLWKRLQEQYYMVPLQDISISDSAKKNKAFGSALLEEGIVSDPELSAFHPESLNTFRVFTVIKDNNPHIVCAYLRMGVGSSFMDHTSEGAIAAPVDLDTGIISHPAMDGFMNSHIFHPDTHKQIVGFQVPRWNECLEEAKRLSLFFPDLHLIGWDMILTSDGRWIPVEGNARPGSPLWQYIVKQGIVPILDKYLNS